MPNSLKVIDPEHTPLGRNLAFEALGLGDEQPVSASLQVAGNALRPLSPVHGNMRLQEDGSRVFGWIRRPRLDLGWRDFVDQPIAEENEQYLFRLYVDGPLVFEQTLFNSQKIFSASEWSALELSTASQNQAEISQIGTHNMSSKIVIDI